MKLEQKYNQKSDEYYCDLTRKLDDLCGYTVKKHPLYKNYILDTRDLWSNSFAIRVPGRTTGSIKVDKNNVIVEIVFATELVGTDNIYPSNVYQEIEQYIGLTLKC